MGSSLMYVSLPANTSISCSISSMIITLVILGPADSRQITLHEVSAHMNHELVAIHHPSGTLLEADMLFNLPCHEQYSRSGGLPTLSKFIGGGSSMSPNGGFHSTAVGGMTKDKT